MVPSIVTKSPALTVWPPIVNCPGLFVDLDGVAADDARLAPAPRDHGRVAGLAAGGRQDALGQVHAGHVLGAGLLANQEDRVVRVLLVMLDGRLGGEDDLAARRPGAGGDPPRDRVSLRPWDRAAASSRWLRLSGLTRLIAVVSSINFSFAISTAIRTAAEPVRLPVRVWSM